MLEPGIEAVRTVGLYPLVLPILRVVVGNPPPLAAAPSAGGPGGGGGGASGLGSHGSRASVCVCVCGGLERSGGGGRPGSPISKGDVFSRGAPGLACNFCSRDLVFVSRGQCPI
jgi:hypothetical protein